MRILAAAAVVLDGERKILLVRRSHEPEAGRWTVPGGKVEAHEELAAAAIRETYEETGFRIDVERELWSLDVEHGPNTYEVHDFLGRVTGGFLKHGDDAMDAGWFTWKQLQSMDLTKDLLRYLNRLDL